MAAHLTKDTDLADNTKKCSGSDISLEIEELPSKKELRKAW